MPCDCNNRLAFATGMGFSVTGLFLALVFSCLYAPPFAHDHAFQQVTCTVQQSHVNGNFCCDPIVSTQAACRAVIPCTQIVVSYIPPEGGNNISAIYYKDYTASTHQIPANNCSYYNCPANYNQALAGGQELIASRGVVGQTYTCYRNPNNPQEVLPEVTSLAVLLLSIILPFVCFVIATVIGCRGYKGDFRRCPMDWEQEEDEEDEEDLVEKVKVKDAVGIDLEKGAVENGEVAQTDEGATDDTHVEVVSLSSQSKLNKADAAVNVDEAPKDSHA